MLTLDLWQNLCRSKGNGKIYVKGWKGKKKKKTTTKMDCKESGAQRNWCFWTVLLEKTFESRLDCKEIQTIHPKGDPSWVFTGRSNVEAETPILWPPDTKSWLIWKEPDAGKGWGQEEKRTTEGEMVGRHHWLNGHEFGWTPGVSDGQGGLACCRTWGCKELDTTEWLNWTELNEIDLIDSCMKAHQETVE